MIKRPKPTDTQDDILEMQKSFLAEQAKNAEFQPAAQLVKVEARKCHMHKTTKFSHQSRGCHFPTTVFTRKHSFFHLFQRKKCRGLLKNERINSTLKQAHQHHQPY